MRGAICAFFLVAMALLLAPSAQAQEAGRVEPSVAAPGQTLHLLYTVPSPGLADVALQRSATCAITAPGGGSTPCEADTSLVVVRVSPGSTTYSWDVPAPAGLGNYTVSFQETDLLALPGGAPAAQAHFEVTSTGAPDAGLTKGSTNATAPPGESLAQIIYSPFATNGAAEPASIAKYVMATTGSAGSLVLLFLANRFGGGP